MEILHHNSKLIQAHAELELELQQLEKATQTLTRWSASLGSMLATTKHRLREHFQMEEQTGYFNSVQERVPHLVEEFRGEHSQLMQTLQDILEETKSATEMGNSLHEKVHTWIEALRSHESKENQLLIDSFGQTTNAH